MFFFDKSGGYVSLTSVLIVDLLGLDKLTNAFGILLVFQGIATSIGPPVVGIMFDTFNSYVLAFVLTGIMIAISGFMCFFIPLIQYYTKRANEK
jgi:MCP family monocarboxylic acid transporter-like MFS transporter 14